jgi:hypothetical protein
MPKENVTPNMQPERLRVPRPLADRVGSIPAAASNPKLFSRFGVDVILNDPFLYSLSEAQRDFGLEIYPATHSGSANEIISVFADEPLLPQRMREARCIEFQFLPSTAERKHAGAWRGDWKPTLPPDLDRAEHVIDRVELARRSSGRSDVAIGAAIAAANVAEDMRFLIDCGFDYVCLIVDGCYDLLPGHRVSLAPVDKSIEDAITVRGKSKPRGFGIRLAAHCSPRQLAEWYRQGIDAVAIDAWIQDRSPSSSARRESFGGILIETPRTGTGNTAWLYDSIRDFLGELRSEQQFFEG